MECAIYAEIKGKEDKSPVRGRKLFGIYLIVPSSL